MGAHADAPQGQPPLGTTRRLACHGPHSQAALAGHDLVVHAAGPFQRSESHAVLKQAVAQRVKYMDVSDDMHYSEQ